MASTLVAPAPARRRASAEGVGKGGLNKHHKYNHNYADSASVPAYRPRAARSPPAQGPRSNMKGILQMPEIPTSTSREQAARRWLRVSAGVMTTFVVTLASTGTGSALAATPTSPP